MSGKSVPPNREFHRIPSKSSSWTALAGFGDTLRKAALFEDYEFLLDFYHMSEHLSNLAEALFGKGRDDAKRWYRRWRDKIKHEPGGVEAMQRAAAYRLKKLKKRKAKLSKKRMESIAREQTFFANNKSKMEYKRFLDNGWPIGQRPDGIRLQRYWSNNDCVAAGCAGPAPAASTSSPCEPSSSPTAGTPSGTTIRNNFGLAQPELAVKWNAHPLDCEPHAFTT